MLGFDPLVEFPFIDDMPKPGGQNAAPKGRQECLPSQRGQNDAETDIAATV